MRIALSTGVGDAPGLNAVIRAAVLSAVSRSGRHFSIVVIAEGACPDGEGPAIRGKSMPGQAVRVGGVAERLADEIEERTKKRNAFAHSRTSSARRTANEL